MNVHGAGLIFATRRLHAPELEAFHEDAEVRAPSLRLAVRRGRGVVTDYALLEHAIAFGQRMRRPQISVLIAGAGRADEHGRRVWISQGEIVASDGGAIRGGTHAYSGDTLKQILVEWDPDVLGAPYARDLESSRLSNRDCQRLEDSALRAVMGIEPHSALVEVLEILRAVGLPFHANPASLLPDQVADHNVASLHHAVAKHLSALDRFPSADDLATALDWNPRTLHRRLAALSKSYAMIWTQWRWALHAQRMLDAVRLLASPRATTEAVARRTGFRSPTSLCHAFSEAGLPSPGVLARAARRDPLDRWAALLGRREVEVRTRARPRARRGRADRVQAT